MQRFGSKKDLITRTLERATELLEDEVAERYYRYLNAAGETEPSVNAIEAHWHGLMPQWALSGRGQITAWIQRGLKQMLALNR